MKKDIRHFRDVTWPIANQFYGIVLDPDFIELFWDRFRPRIDIKTPPSPNSKIAIECRSAVKKYLQGKNYPVTWVEPLCQLILSGVLDLPLWDGIELVVGSQAVLKQDRERQQKNSTRPIKISGERKLSIVITSKMSIQKLIHFIKIYKNEILKYQDLLELPKTSNTNGKKLMLATKIIMLKDYEDLSFTEIATKLSQEKGLNQKEGDYFSDENNIKSLYYDYKKYLRLK